MKFAVLGAALSIAAFATPEASAQPYCAYYANGTRECGIPALQTCTDSVVGVGGYCGPDETQSIPPNFIQRLEQDNLPPPQLQPNTPQAQQPGGLDWMPPPPQESQ